MCVCPVCGGGGSGVCACVCTVYFSVVKFKEGQVCDRF